LIRNVSGEPLLLATQDRQTQYTRANGSSTGREKIPQASQGPYSTRRLGFMHGRPPSCGRNIRRMPLLDLTDAEIATAAQACRALAYQEGERAKRLENPTTRGPIEAASQRYARLAQKIEAARKR